MSEKDLNIFREALQQLQKLNTIDLHKRTLLASLQLDPTNVFKQISLGNYIHHTRMFEWLSHSTSGSHPMRQEDMFSWLKFYDYDGNSRISFSQFQKALNWQFNLQSSRRTSVQQEARLAQVLLQECQILSGFYQKLKQIQSHPKDLFRKIDKLGKQFINPKDLQQSLGEGLDYYYINMKITKSERDTIMPHQFITLLESRFTISQEFCKSTSPQRTPFHQDRQTIIHKLSGRNDPDEVREFTISGAPVVDSKTMSHTGWQKSILKSQQSPHQSPIKSKSILISSNHQQHSIRDRPQHQYMQPKYIDSGHNMRQSHYIPHGNILQQNTFRQSQVQSNNFQSQFHKNKDEHQLSKEIEAQMRYQMSLLQQQLASQKSLRKEAQQEIGKLEHENMLLRQRLSVIQNTFKHFIGLQGKIEAIDKEIYLMSNQDRKDKQYRLSVLQKEMRQMTKESRGERDLEAEVSTVLKTYNEPRLNQTKRSIIVECFNHISTNSKRFFQYRHQFYVNDRDLPADTHQYSSTHDLANALQSKNCFVSHSSLSLLFKQIKIRLKSVNSSTLRKFCHSSQARTKMELIQFLEGMVPFLQGVDSQLRILQKTCSEGELIGLLEEGQKVSYESVENFCERVGMKGKQLQKWLGLSAGRYILGSQLRAFLKPAN